ncbi:hypothetical protein C9890_0350 [Perkinsus sp. BL_2016]|nr:hypothetical protein C9890_0350 [Perkinsus sp. BL_2016]
MNRQFIPRCRELNERKMENVYLDNRLSIFRSDFGSITAAAIRAAAPSNISTSRQREFTKHFVNTTEWQFS